MDKSNNFGRNITTRILRSTDQLRLQMRPIKIVQEENEYPYVQHLAHFCKGFKRRDQSRHGGTGQLVMCLGTSPTHTELYPVNPN